MNRSRDESESFEKLVTALQPRHRIWLERGISLRRLLQSLAWQCFRGSKLAEAKGGSRSNTIPVRSPSTIFSVQVIVLMASIVATPLQAIAAGKSQVTASLVQSIVESYRSDGLDDYADDLSRFEKLEISNPVTEETRNTATFKYDPVVLCRLFHYVQSRGNDAIEWREISTSDLPLPAYYKTDPCDHLLPGISNTAAEKARNARISKLDSVRLRRIFQQPEYNVGDGLDDYGEDMSGGNEIDERMAAY